ncbi:MAG: lamin tail domain-containing protein [Lentimicrobium sp.]|nr:lamin tail domain-containing protein [Lentimicrobium sp.]
MRDVLFILFFIPLLSFAQLSDDFSDGDFTQNPEWTGNTDQFTINASGQLQLNSSGEGLSGLVTTFSADGLLEWRIWVRLNFSPSDNNQAKIYLLSDNPNLNEPLNGFYLKLGEGGSADAIELYRQSGTVNNLICRGNDGLIATAFAISIKVLKDEDGLWSVYADQAGGEDFQLQGSGEDAQWNNFTHFGILCKYTSSNATRFYFDDIYAGPPLVDNTPPSLMSIEVISQNNLKLNFSETVDENTANDINNYSADNGLGNPLAAGRDIVEKSVVHLLFEDAFMQGSFYNLTVSNIKDIAGNVMQPVVKEFAYYSVKAYDVLITEIMADPDPPVSLPNNEYLEIFNRSNFPIQLENWVLNMGTTRRILPRKIIGAGEHHIITSTDALPAFTGYGEVIGFSSISLSNTGASLVLRNSQGSIIHSLVYSDTWYRDAVKKNGGWSLEMIDPANPCAGAENWRASINPSGGTPGSINSVNGVNPDILSPEIEKISITGPETIRVFFNESIDSLSISSPARYRVDNGFGSPSTIKLNPPDYRSANLNFDAAFADGVIYTLSVSIGMSDCAGNQTEQELTARFAIPSLPESMDIVINEVLSDPRATGTEFVEIYNRSNKVVDLKNIWLATRDKNTGEVTSVKETAPEGRLMFPEEYLVLTKDANVVKSEYFTSNPNGFISLSSFPVYAIASGTVVLLTPWEVIVDEFAYNSDMHFSLLNTTDGVSLERINFNRPTQDPGNWHSASQNVGFATPGYQNSQFMLSPEGSDEVLITPDIFSPDGDGFNDILAISCNFAEPGYSVTIRIFDSNGREVRLLARNEPAGTGNTFNWDGTTDKREKAPIGIYIIHIEVFNLAGKVKQFKKTAVLGGKLK